MTPLQPPNHSMVLPSPPPPRIECVGFMFTDRAQERALLNWLKDDMRAFRESRECLRAALDLESGRRYAGQMLAILRDYYHE